MLSDRISTVNGYWIGSVATVSGYSWSIRNAWHASVSLACVICYLHLIGKGHSTVRISRSGRMPTTVRVTVTSRHTQLKPELVVSITYTQLEYSSTSFLWSLSLRSKTKKRIRWQQQLEHRRERSGQQLGWPARQTQRAATELQV